MKVNINNLFFYILLTIIFFLSGNYFGGYFDYINIFLILILFCDIVHLLLTVKFIYFNQSFSTEHPQKGDVIKYNNYVKNSLPVMTSPITIEYSSCIGIDNSTFNISMGKCYEKKIDFTLPYRGVYEVGYNKILVRDFLNIFTLERQIWKRTFYVYPRLKSLDILSYGKGQKSDKNVDLTGKNRDSLDSLVDYIPGSKSSLISWKHLASMGEPYIKKFSSLDNRNLSIFIDRSILPEYRLGPVDDLILETSVSIINQSIKNGEKVLISNSNLYINNFKDFDDYYKSTVFEEFNTSFSKVEQEFYNMNFKRDDTIFIISPLENIFFINSELYIKFPKLELIIISKHMNKEKRRLVHTLIERNRLNEDRIHWID